MSVERELKYSLIDDDFPVKYELEPLFTKAGYRLVADGLKLHTDHYFDDARGRIQHAGWALRIRLSKNKKLACLKSQGDLSDGVHTRQEIEAEYSGTLAEQNWPAVIQTKLLGLTFYDLTETLILDCQRTNYRVFKDFELLATLSFDLVKASTAQQERSVSFKELEIEAAQNTRQETLLKITDLVSQTVSINANSSHKLERALSLLSLSAAL